MTKEIQSAILEAVKQELRRVDPLATDRQIAAALYQRLEREQPQVLKSLGSLLVNEFIAALCDPKRGPPSDR